MIGKVRPTRVAVAGCGGAAFGIHLPVLAAHPGFEVVAVADRVPARAQQAAARFGVARIARDVADLLAGADLLAVLTGVHEPLIEAALGAGVHVFTEKPVSLDVTATRHLRRQATLAGLLLEVGTIRAYDPGACALLDQVPPALLRGGWLVKADGIDEAARRRFLPPGMETYTFAADPPQPTPPRLDAAGRRALEILLWQGYHLLTLLALAAPGAQPVSCALGSEGDGVHAVARAGRGPLVSVVIGPASHGVHVDQAFLAGADRAVTAVFGPPYGPGASGVLTVHGTSPPAMTKAPASAAQIMWTAVARRLADQTPGRTAHTVGRSSAALAEDVERLAYGLARQTIAGTGPTALVPAPAIPSDRQATT